MSTLSQARDKAIESKASWHASLQLKFIVKNQKTVPGLVKHFGPLRVQRPFYPESPAICHSYILHPPGGVVGGDSLHLDINIEQDAHAVITTPGATKIYRNTHNCEIKNDLTLAKRAVLEWMPQETIVYDDSLSKLQTHIDMRSDSKLFYWELVCLGLPAINERYNTGHLQQELIINIDEQIVLVEKTAIQGSSAFLQEKWGLQNRYVSGTLVMKNDINIDLNRLRDVIKHYDNIIVGITEKNQLLICRALGNEVEEMRKMFVRVWTVWRELALNKKIVTPRIWNT